MRKGCFLLIAFITVALGILFYVIKKYGGNIEAYAKKELIEFAVADMLDEIDPAINNVYIDSVKAELQNFVDDIDTDNFGFEYEEITKLLTEVSLELKEGNLNEENFVKIKELIVEYEKSKKD